MSASTTCIKLKCLYLSHEESKTENTMVIDIQYQCSVTSLEDQLGFPLLNKPILCFSPLIGLV